MKTKIFRNATVVVGSNLSIIEKASIIIKEDYIAEILTKDLKKGLNLRGALVIPGFVNAHTHVGDRGLKDLVIGLPTEKAVSPYNSVKYRYLNNVSSEELKKMMIEGVYEMLASGITVFCDFREGGAEGVKLLQQATRDLPIKTIIFGEPTVFPQEWERYLQEVKDILAVADGLGLSDISVFTDEQLMILREQLFQTGKRLAVHIAETSRAQQVSKERWGMSEVNRIMKFSPDLLIHMTNATDDDIVKVAINKTPVVACPRANCVLGDGIPPLYSMWKANIPMCLGTDNFMLASPNMFREMDFFSRLMRGQSKCPDAISARDVLAMATIEGAHALGVADEYGSLEPGKKASFVVLDVNSINLRPIRDIFSAVVHRADLADILLVIAHGEIVVDRLRR